MASNILDCFSVYVRPRTVDIKLLNHTLHMGKRDKWPRKDKILFSRIREKMTEEGAGTWERITLIFERLAQRKRSLDVFHAQSLVNALNHRSCQRSNRAFHPIKVFLSFHGCQCYGSTCAYWWLCSELSLYK